MLVLMFLLSRNKLNSEQLSQLQELAAGFGATLAKQLELSEDDEQIGNDDESPLTAFAATEQVVDDPELIGYLEDCLLL
jgi:hypothetical protein